MKDMGVPHEPDVTKPDNTTVFYFPEKAPEGTTVFRDSRTAIEQLEYWKMFNDEWCEHKPSITITVKEHEWLEVGAWVYKHFDDVSGLSFLPHTDHVYAQAPYQECTEEEYLAVLAKMPKDVDWSRLSDYEMEDNTASSQTLACTGSVCEIVDIGDV
jgi:ribonucleoside-triphosphate reductase (thioredoxin)